MAKTLLEKMGCPGGPYTKKSLKARAKILKTNIEKGLYRGEMLIRARSYAAKYAHLARNFKASK